MLVYNTTYHVDDDIHDQFIVWIKECYIPQATQAGILHAMRLCRILNRLEESGTSYSLHREVENSALLHRWHLGGEAALTEEMNKIFTDKVVGFSTLMEVVE